MEKGLVAQIIIAHLSLPNENVIFELSLKGFTAAYKKATIIQN
jgi:invasion protein IalB